LKNLSKRKETNDFLSILYKNDLKKSNGYVKVSDPLFRCAINYINSLSLIQLKRLVSDPIWNDYKSYRYLCKYDDNIYKDIINNESVYKTWYGSLISRVIKQLICLDNDFSLFLAKHASGLILNVLLRNSYGEPIRIGCQRALKSKDPRVRLTAAKIGSICIAKKLQNDPIGIVRAAAIRRIGVNYCYKQHLNDPNRKIKAEAILVASLKDIDYNSILGSLMEKNTRNWIDDQILRSLLSKMDPKEIVYYLNLVDKDKLTAGVLKHKLSQVKFH